MTSKINLIIRESAQVIFKYEKEKELPPEFFFAYNDLYSTLRMVHKKKFLEFTPKKYQEAQTTINALDELLTYIETIASKKNNKYITILDVIQQNFVDNNTIKNIYNDLFKTFPKKEKIIKEIK